MRTILILATLSLAAGCDDGDAENPSDFSFFISSTGGPMGGGHVKFFNEQKGFGFVVPESGGADVYVHASALRRSGVSTLMPEQKVRFSTRQGMKGIEVDRIELA